MSRNTRLDHVRSAVIVMSFGLLSAACNPVSFRSTKPGGEVATSEPSQPVAPRAESTDTTNTSAQTPPVESPVVPQGASPKVPTVTAPEPNQPVAPKSPEPRVPTVKAPPAVTPPADVQPPVVVKAPPVVVADAPKAVPKRREPATMAPPAPPKMASPKPVTPKTVVAKPKVDVPPAAGIVVAQAAPVKTESQAKSIAAGECTGDLPLLSCLPCPAAKAQTQGPTLSKKGQALFEVLSRSCRIPNGSDPEGYEPPSDAELMSRLNRLSPDLYPDTPMTKLQDSTVKALLADEGTRKKLFGGIFYSGVTPETIAFETYFGISTIEARYSFCYSTDESSTGGNLVAGFSRASTSPLHSKVYGDCMLLHDPTNCRENDDYESANVYRAQLRKAMTESIYNPFVPTVAPEPKCEWQKVEMPMGDQANALVATWILNGYTVGAEVPSQGVCGRVDATPVVSPAVVEGTPAVFAAYRCESR